MLASTFAPRSYPAPLAILLLASYAALVAAQDADCHLSHDGVSYDFSPLAGSHHVYRDRSTPPTTMKDVIEFSICGELSFSGDVAAGDQCPAGTTACLTKTNTRESQDRIITVVPLAQTSHTADFTTLESPKGIRITRLGKLWPDDGGEQQSFELDLLCDPADDAGQPGFTSYDGKTAKVTWKHTAACAFKGTEPPKDDDSVGGGGGDGSSESVGSGLGWFFLVLVLAFVAYFALGAYYNYATYGATGFDLIPHRDFWREVPYMLQDVFAHLCSSFRPRHTSSRGGYIAV